MKKIFILMLCLFFISACKQQQTAVIPASQKVQEQILSNDGYEKYLFDYVTSGLFSLGNLKTFSDLESKIISMFGLPIKVSENKNDYLLFKNYYYVGLIISVWQNILHDNYTGMEFIELTSSGYDVLYDLKIGKSKEQVENYFGKPDMRLSDSNYYHYFVDTNYSLSQVSFTFENDKIIKIIWTGN
jgi:hypothetical protein